MDFPDGGHGGVTMRFVRRGPPHVMLLTPMSVLLIAAVGTSCIQPDTALDDFGTSGQSSVTGDDAGPAVALEPSEGKAEPEGGDDGSENGDDEETVDDPAESAPASGGKVADAGVKVADAGKPRAADAATALASDSGATVGPADGGAPPSGTATLTKLSFSVTTATLGGRYSPRNIYAIWVTDAQGKFVKTLAKFARIRARYLTGWNAASAGNVVDAVSGATVTTHGARMATWNFTDVSKKVVPDGEYKLVVELTDADKTGVSHSIPFTKGASAMKLTPADHANFKAMSLVLE